MAEPGAPFAAVICSTVVASLLAVRSEAVMDAVHRLGQAVLGAADDLGRRDEHGLAELLLGGIDADGLGPGLQFRDLADVGYALL